MEDIKVCVQQFQALCNSAQTDYKLILSMKKVWIKIIILTIRDSPMLIRIQVSIVFHKVSFLNKGTDKCWKTDKNS